MELQEYHAMRDTEDTHWWFRSLHELVLKSLKRRVPKGDLVILDAGCGTGGLLRKLSALGSVRPAEPPARTTIRSGRFGRAEGIDISETAVRFCKERGLRAKQADLNVCGLPPGHYDVITCIDLLYHRGIADVPAVLRRFHASLKPGGILFLHLPAFERLRSAHDNRVHTARRFRLGEVRNLLERAGFEIEERSYRVMLLLPLVVLTRVMERVRRRQGVQGVQGRQRRQRSDLRPVPGPVNAVLLFISRVENALLRLMALPVGVSLYVVARRGITEAKPR